METIGYIFIVIGAFLLITGSIGILRFPNFFSRLHPAGITDSLGAPLTLFGVILIKGLTLFSAKVSLLILLIYITSPTACHALARAAHSQKQAKKKINP
jgi:multicomponent Na+:H+ antiporter subunit G